MRLFLNLFWLLCLFACHETTPAEATSEKKAVYAPPSIELIGETAPDKDGMHPQTDV